MSVVEIQPVRWKQLKSSTPAPSAQIRVDSNRFLELLISRRRLTRADAPETGLSGLFDHENGNWYFTVQGDVRGSQRRPR